MDCEHKTWIPFIAVGLSFAVGLGYLAGYATPRIEPAQTAEASSVADYELQVQTSRVTIDKIQYQDTVRQLLASVTSSGNADSAYQRILDLRVPSEYQDLHLELTIAINKWRSGNKEEAKERLDQLVKSHSWLAL